MMDKKLTLRMNASTIEEAKLYASKQGISLSSLVENYLVVVLTKDAEEEITPLVKSLCGIAALPNGFDWKAERAEYLIEKNL